MVFYNDKWIIINKSRDELLLVRQSKEELILEKIGRKQNSIEKEIVADNLWGEYDAGIGSQGEVYIIYQNTDMNLIISLIDGGVRKDIRLTSKPIPEVIDLNILLEDDRINIVYLIKISDKNNKYRIYHHCYKGGDWNTYIVDEIIAGKALNPIKLIQDKEKIMLAYYINGLEIGLREFNQAKMEWSDFFSLVVNPREKLYIDMIKYKNHIHLVYCEFQGGNLIIRYEKFNYLNESYYKELERNISNRASPSHPTLIIYGKDIWVSWIELDSVMSRVSYTSGQDWSDSIYRWNNSKNIDLIRYKYLTVDGERDRLLDYSFGSIYPDIEFIGFGSLEKAGEIQIKKDS